MSLGFLAELLKLGFKMSKDGEIEAPSSLEEDQVLILFKAFEVLIRINDAEYLALVVGRFLYHHEIHVEKLSKDFLMNYISLLISVSEYEQALELSSHLQSLLTQGKIPNPTENHFSDEILLKHLLMLQKNNIQNHHHQIISMAKQRLAKIEDDKHSNLNHKVSPKIITEYLMILLVQYTWDEDLKQSTEIHQIIMVYVNEHLEEMHSLKKYIVTSDSIFIKLLTNLNQTTELIAFYENRFEVYKNEFTHDQINWLHHYLDQLTACGETEKYEQKVNEFILLLWQYLKDNRYDFFEITYYLEILDLQKKIQMKANQIQAYQDHLKDVIALFLNENWIEQLHEIEVNFNLIETLIQTLLYLRNDEVFEHFVFENKIKQPNPKIENLSIEWSHDPRFPFHIYLSPKLYHKYYALYLIFHKNEPDQAKELISFDLATTSKTSNEYLQLKLITYFYQAKANKVKISTLSRAMDDFTLASLTQSLAISKMLIAMIPRAEINERLSDDMKLFLFKHYFHLSEQTLAQAKTKNLK